MLDFTTTECIVALVTSYILYLVGLGVWRLHLHPLAKFPGPRLAALTLWYECYWDVVKGGQYFREIERLHSIYGPIVRISPEELHVKDPEWFNELYPVGNRKRDKYVWFLSEGTNATSSATVRHDVHRQRRSALAPSFSKQSVMAIEETLIRPNIAAMLERLDEYAQSETVVVLGTVFSSLTVDTLVQMWFGAESGQTYRWGFFPKWTEVIQPLLTGSHFLRHFPFAFALFGLIPKSYLEKMDGISFIFNLQAIVEECHPPSERSLTRLSDEGFSFLMASTESTAQSLSALFFHLADNPKVLAELRAQLNRLSPEENGDDVISWSALESLTYMRYIVCESMRVTATVTGRLARVAPDEVLKYRDWDIPPGTPISMDHHFTHLDPVIFLEPRKFNPDRWQIAAEKGESYERYFLPFGRGSRMCIGMNLAKALMYRVVATIVRRYDFELFDTNREDVEIVRDNLTGAVKADSKGVRVRLRRRQQSKMG
ncbi:cytochrome P450 [Phaeosphaeriaceae sp. PMI808]|nr:cytochrome P450 [Phaeosphaeriaceae sp. PMI808]